MIHPGAALKPLLKFRGAFPNIVGIPQHLPPVLLPKGPGKSAAQCRGAPQMLLHRLLPAIRGNMRKIPLLGHIHFPLFLCLYVYHNPQKVQ